MKLDLARYSRLHPIEVPAGMPGPGTVTCSLSNLDPSPQYNPYKYAFLSQQSVAFAVTQSAVGNATFSYGLNLLKHGSDRFSHWSLGNRSRLYSSIAQVTAYAGLYANRTFQVVGTESDHINSKIQIVLV